MLSAYTTSSHLRSSSSSLTSKLPLSVSKRISPAEKSKKQPHQRQRRRWLESPRPPPQLSPSPGYHPQRRLFIQSFFVGAMMNADSATQVAAALQGPGGPLHGRAAEPKPLPYSQTDGLPEGIASSSADLLGLPPKPIRRISNDDAEGENMFDIDESTIGVPTYDDVPALVSEEPLIVGTNSLTAKLGLPPSYPSTSPFFTNVGISPSHPTPKIVGHRGSPFLELENTRRGFQVSADVGCDAVELDVFLLKCGTLVVFHGSGTDENPGWLLDYCGVEGTILDYTAEEARQLTFNPSHEEFGCSPERILDRNTAYIPTLEEVLLDAKSNGLTIKIELKGPNTADPVLEMVERLNMVDQCHYSSFAHERIARIRQLRPERLIDGTYRYKTGALFTEPPSNFVELAQGVGASEVHLKYDCCTRENVRAIHDAGMDSMAWFRGPTGMAQDSTMKYHDVGNEDERMYEVVARTGVRSLCVNKPDVLAKMLKGQRTALPFVPPQQQQLWGVVPNPLSGARIHA